MLKLVLVAALRREHQHHVVQLTWGPEVSLIGSYQTALCFLNSGTEYNWIVQDSLYYYNYYHDHHYQTICP